MCTGHRLVATDGSTLSLPEEKSNRAFFGLPRCSRGQTAFPKLRISMLLELGMRAPFAWCSGPLQGIGAVTAKRTDIEYGAGRAIACRSGVYGLSLVVTGKHLLWRACGQPHFPVKEAYEYGSWRSVFRGKGIDNSCEVRVIDYTLKQEDAMVYSLVTTMLDPEEAPRMNLPHCTMNGGKSKRPMTRSKRKCWDQGL